MEGLQARLGNFTKGRLRAGRSVTELYAFIKAMLADGGVEVSTPFAYKGEAFEFRTLFQPDGDVLLYLPPLKERQHDSGYLEAVAEHYKLHLEKTREVFATAGANTSFFGMVIDLGLVGANLWPLHKTLSAFTWETLALTVSFSVLTWLFRKYFRPLLSRLGAGIFARLLWWWLKKKHPGLVRELRQAKQELSNLRNTFVPR